jgi:hypothetical protein
MTEFIIPGSGASSAVLTISRQGSDLTWAELRDAPVGDNELTYPGWIYLYASSMTDRWRGLRRPFLLFDTAALYNHTINSARIEIASMSRVSDYPNFAGDPPYFGIYGSSKTGHIGYPDLSWYGSVEDILLSDEEYSMYGALTDIVFHLNEAGKAKINTWESAPYVFTVFTTRLDWDANNDPNHWKAGGLGRIQYYNWGTNVRLIIDATPPSSIGPPVVRTLPATDIVTE